MTPGGAIVVGATVLIAALDGGLTALVVASVLGGGAYVCTRRTMNHSPRRILEIQRTLLEGQVQQAVEDGLPDEDVKALRKRIAEEIEQLSAVTEGQRWGNKEMAAAVGVASFACPPLGLVALAGLTHDKWVPVVEHWCEAPGEADETGGQLESTHAIHRHLVDLLSSGR